MLIGVYAEADPVTSTARRGRVGYRWARIDSLPLQVC